MKILIFISHPAQFLFYRNAVAKLKEKGYTVHLLIKSKDILAELIDQEGWDYVNIHPGLRGRSKVDILWSLLVRDFRIWAYSRKHDISLFMGSDASVAHIAKLSGKPCITTLEDDYQVIKNLARLTYPFTTHILVPGICDVGLWKNKKIGYEGYMKLAYLHPEHFNPDRSKVKLANETPYFIIRLSGLEAHHDSGIKGISFSVLNKIIKYLSLKGEVYISSEKQLPTEYNKYKLSIRVQDIHHYLWFSEMLICDSQSMTVEASVLGVPNIRVSSFSGKISVLEELEEKYQLTCGILPENEEQVFSKLDELLSMHDLHGTFRGRRNKMLNEKIDVSSFLIWFIGSYPESVGIMKDNPDFQRKFIINH